MDCDEVVDRLRRCGGNGIAGLKYKAENDVRDENSTGRRLACDDTLALTQMARCSSQSAQRTRGVHRRTNGLAGISRSDEVKISNLEHINQTTFMQNSSRCWHSA